VISKRLSDLFVWSLIGWLGPVLVSSTDPVIPHNTSAENTIDHQLARQKRGKWSRVEPVQRGCGIPRFKHGGQLAANSVELQRKTAIKLLHQSYPSKLLTMSLRSLLFHRLAKL